MGRLGWAEGEAEARGICDRASAGPAGARGAGLALAVLSSQGVGLGHQPGTGCGEGQGLGCRDSASQQPCQLPAPGVTGASVLRGACGWSPQHPSLQRQMAGGVLCESIRSESVKERKVDDEQLLLKSNMMLKQTSRTRGLSDTRCGLCA